MKVPKRFIVEYEDGSTKGIEFNQLSNPFQLELSHKGLCPPPSEMLEPSKHYLLLLWKSGWQEVMSVEKTPVELLRYYVLERVEEVGRLALEVKGDYPILFTIKRLPKELDRLMLLGSEHPKVYRLEPKIKREEGDKIEHIEFDKAERHFQPELDKEAEAGFRDIADALKKELEKKGFTPQRILDLNQTKRIKEYKDLIKVLNLRATEKQKDVYGFIQWMIENLTALKH